MWIKSFKEFHQYRPLLATVCSDGLVRVKHDVRSQVFWHARAAFPDWEVKLDKRSTLLC